MKQIAKSEQIKGRLRASYGPDANLDNLAVYETVALTTLPLRKTGGIFQGARASLSLLSEMAAAVNRESVPVQIQHDSSALPQGRVFYGEVVDDELRDLFAIDAVAHPEVVQQLDSGTIDQVSVGMVNKRLTCSACGYDFADPANLMGLYTLTCDEGHVIGQDGVHVHIDGLKLWGEQSLVGIGAAVGARIAGPSDARLQGNEAFRLAASANPGPTALFLSPTLKDPISMDKDTLAAFTAATTDAATAKANLAVMTGERDVARTELTARDATIVELNTQVATLTTASADSVKNKEAAEAALTALQAHAKKVVVAVGKPDTEIPADVTAVLALIDEHSAAFAAIIPVNGAANGNPSDGAPTTPARPIAAFRSPR